MHYRITAIWFREIIWHSTFGEVWTLVIAFLEGNSKIRLWQAVIQVPYYHHQPSVLSSHWYAYPVEIYPHTKLDRNCRNFVYIRKDRWTDGPPEFQSIRSSPGDDLKIEGPIFVPPWIQYCQSMLWPSGNNKWIVSCYQLTNRKGI